LVALRLLDVEADAEIRMFRGGSPLADMWNLTWVQIHGHLVSLGASPEVIGAAQAELGDQQRWFCAPPVVRAWATHQERAAATR
jgi:hypothetical protein